MPGIGTFTIENIPARLDFINKKIHAPLPVIRFTMDHTPADAHFITYLAKEWQMDEETAITSYNEIVYQHNTALVDVGNTEIPFIGKLTREFAHTYSFQPAYQANNLLEEVAAERIINVQNGHEVRVGEDYLNSQDILANQPAKKSYSWLIAAGVITMVDALIIAAYHYHYL